MEWAWKCCGNCHLSDKCELKEELVNKGQLCEKYLPKPINEELDFVQEHKKIPVNLQIIKQEPKTDKALNLLAEWVATGRMFIELNGEQIVYEVICKQCKGLSYFRRVTSVLFGADYCPNCGARMEVF